MIKGNENDYIARLYCQATGKVYDENNFCLKYDGMTWLREKLYPSLVLYKKILLSNGINYNSNKVTEIGKSRLDTVTSPNSQTKIITPYNSEFNRKIKDNRDITFGELVFLGQRAYLDLGKRKILLPLNDLIITQNSDLEQMKEWLKFINNGQSIAIGVHGANTDLDKEAKITTLNDLANATSDYKLVEAEYNGSYACLLRKKRK